MNGTITHLLAAASACPVFGATAGGAGWASEPRSADAAAASTNKQGAPAAHRVRAAATAMLRASMALIIALLSPAPALAQDSTTARPVFEHVHALAFDAEGRTLWLGTHTGLFRSENGGRTWEEVPLPAKSGAVPDVMNVTPHPAQAEVLYVGTHEAGILKTTNRGKTWAAVNGTLPGLDVHGLAIDPRAPSKLHALVRDPGAGLYRTTDGGQTWVRVDDGPAGETKVLVSVNIPTGMGGIFLFAGTAEGLQLSPDCF